MKEFLQGKWGKVAIVALFLCIGLALGAVFSDDPSINENTPKPSDGETMLIETQSTTQSITEPPTQTITQPATEALAQDQTVTPTQTATESAKPASFHGWEILSPDMEYIRNEDGLIVFPGAYYNHWINGFLIGKTGVDFLSFHSGEPVWIAGKQEHITITHEGKEYFVDFAWGSHMGEIGVNFASRTIQTQSSNGTYVSPIPGNDRFIRVSIPVADSDYWYLLNLETLELVDPLAKVDPKYRMNSISGISPDATKAILYEKNSQLIWDFASGAVMDVSEFTGIESANKAFWVSATQLAVVTSRIEVPQEGYADAVLYDLTDGSSKELYKNARYARFMDVGGLEHHGRLYCYLDSETKMTVFVDPITGMQGTVSHQGLPIARQMGGYGIEYYDEGICYLLKPDGIVTPLFTTNST